MKGKEKCDFLRTIRKEIADKNGIDYAPKPCTHEGDCLGTCPACDKEADYIMEELRKMKADGKEINVDTLKLKELERYIDSVEVDEEDDVEDGIIEYRGQPTMVEMGDIAAPDYMEGEDDDEKGQW